MEANETITYLYYVGNLGNPIPLEVTRLIVDSSARRLPDGLCEGLEQLQEVQLNEGLVEIGKRAFYRCGVREVTIPSTTKIIGQRAFAHNNGLTSVAFTEPSSLRRVEFGAFIGTGLERIFAPPSPRLLDSLLYSGCTELVEVNLAPLANLRVIAQHTFVGCQLLQAVRLPSSLEIIHTFGFFYCPSLVTIEFAPPAPIESIIILPKSIEECPSLINIQLPTGTRSLFSETFPLCTRLEEHFAQTNTEIIAGLTRRFEDHPVHEKCYHSASTTPEELHECIIMNTQEGPERMQSIADQFGATPFHILCSSFEPRLDLFNVLLDNFPSHVLGWKDVNGKRAMDYLLHNWTDNTAQLFELGMQRWMIHSMDGWNAFPREKVEAMWRHMGAILSEANRERRMDLFNEACSLFEHYEITESMTLLELALWKQKITEEMDLDREVCRALSQADILLSNVGAVLGLKLDVESE